MKLRNKKTGEIGEAGLISTSEGKIIINNTKDVDEWYEYSSLAELNEEWEDYEEPKEYYAIDLQGDIIKWARHSWDEKTTNKIKEIGNYFETKEEAEKAVKKLKALANLRKRGLKFNGWDSADRGLVGEFEIYCDAVNLDGIEQELIDDLDLLFGGGE